MEFPWNTTRRAGDDELRVTVDPGHVVPELVEWANNVASVNQTVPVNDVPLA